MKVPCKSCGNVFIYKRNKVNNCTLVTWLYLKKNEKLGVNFDQIVPYKNICKLMKKSMY